MDDPVLRFRRLVEDYNSHLFEYGEYAARRTQLLDMLTHPEDIKTPAAQDDADDTVNLEEYQAKQQAPVSISDPVKPEQERPAGVAVPVSSVADRGSKKPVIVALVAVTCIVLVGLGMLLGGDDKPLDVTEQPVTASALPTSYNVSLADLLSRSNWGEEEIAQLDGAWLSLSDEQRSVAASDPSYQELVATIRSRAYELAALPATFKDEMIDEIGSIENLARSMAFIDNLPDMQSGLVVAQQVDSQVPDVLAEDAPAPEDALARAEDTPVPEDALAGAQDTPVPEEALAGAEAAPVPEETLAGAEAAPVPEETLAGAEAAPVPEEALAGAEDTPVPEEALAGAEDTPVPEETLAGAEAAPVPEEALASAEAAPVPEEALASAEAAPVPVEVSATAVEPAEDELESAGATIETEPAGKVLPAATTGKTSRPAEAVASAPVARKSGKRGSCNIAKAKVKPGYCNDVFPDGREGPVLAVIAAGSVTPEVSGAKPRPTVQLPQPLAVQVYETKLKDYLMFCEQTQRDCKTQSSAVAQGQDATTPVTSVSLSDAVEYARWMTGQTGGTYRLPTREEAEYYIRGGTVERTFSGEKIDLAAAHFDSDSPVGRSGTAGKLNSNPFRLHHTLGNVREWCSPEGGEFLVTGGDFSSPREKLESAYVEILPSQQGDERTGFRLVREVEQ